MAVALSVDRDKGAVARASARPWYASCRKMDLQRHGCRETSMPKFSTALPSRHSSRRPWAVPHGGDGRAGARPARRRWTPRSRHGSVRIPSVSGSSHCGPCGLAPRRAPRCFVLRAAKDGARPSATASNGSATRGLCECMPLRRCSAAGSRTRSKRRDGRSARRTATRPV